MNPQLAAEAAVHRAGKESLAGQRESKAKAVVRENKFTPDRLRDTLFEQIRRICLDPKSSEHSMQDLANLAAAINKSIEVECLQEQCIRGRGK